jgi:hypothetical protein
MLNYQRVITMGIAIGETHGTCAQQAPCYFAPHRTVGGRNIQNQYGKANTKCNIPKSTSKYQSRIEGIWVCPNTRYIQYIIYGTIKSGIVTLTFTDGLRGIIFSDKTQYNPMISQVD